jgi:hypothetical protein
MMCPKMLLMANIGAPQIVSEENRKRIGDLAMMLKPMLFLFIIKETGSGIPRELAIKLRGLKVSALI